MPTESGEQDLAAVLREAGLERLLSCVDSLTLDEWISARNTHGTLFTQRLKNIGLKKLGDRRLNLEYRQRFSIFTL